MIVDNGKDGWDVGTPAKTGDYFKTGTAFEGFKVEYNGTVYENNASGLFGIPGNNVATVDGDTIKKAIWVGEVAGKFRLRQTLEIDDNKPYLVISAELTNLGSSSADMYYTRVADPDQEVDLTGVYATLNTVVSQYDSTGKSIVKSTGLQYGFYFGYGSSDYRSKVAVAYPWSLNPSQYYNGTGGALLSGGTNQDDAIAITFYQSSVLPGNTTSFQTYSITNAADENSVTCLPSAYLSAVQPNIYSGFSTDLKVTFLGTAPWTFTVDGTNYTTSSNPYILNIAPIATTTYRLSNVSNACGVNPHSDSLTVTVIPCSPPVAVLTGTQLIGSGSSATLSASFTGIGPWHFSLNGQSYTADYSPYAISVSPSVTTTYSITNLYNFCGPGSASGSATVSVFFGCDPNEDNNTVATATPINVLPYISGQLCLNTTTDDDWYKFNVNEKIYYIKIRPFSYSSTGNYKLVVSLVSGLLTIETQSYSGSSVDTYAFLYKSDGTTLLSSDDDGGDGLFSKIMYTVCLPDLSHSGVISSDTYNAINTISSQANVSTLTNYNAGKAILLLPGFQAGENEVFKAEIKGCR